jgi:hypothetical protein
LNGQSPQTKFEKEFEVKKQITSLLAIAILLTTFSATSARAQSDRLIAANIPFNFMIKDRALPAGEYLFTLVQIGGADGVKIQSTDGHITAFVLTRSASAKAMQDNAKLVFNRYENQYFLAQVYGMEEGALQQLARPRAEERLTQNASAPERSRVTVTAHRK